MRDGAKTDSRSKKGRVEDTPEGNPTHTASGSKLAPGLYLVATPIGNLDDITLRALKVLGNAEVIACEDTRVTGKLLSLLGLSTTLTPYHEHNAERARPALLARIRAGEAVALVSDAGTPLVSDPGYRLVQACIAENLPVTSLPGASAALTALQLSGLPSDRFLFAGFLPVKSGARRGILSELAAVPATLIFYESPRRLDDCLPDMLAVLGDRPAAVARELTKLYEEIQRGRLSELIAHYTAVGLPKGEAVIIVGPPDAERVVTTEDVDAQLRHALLNNSLRDAAALVATATGLPKREVYSRAVALENLDDRAD